MRKIFAGLKINIKKIQPYSYKGDPAIITHKGYYNPIDKEFSTSFEVDNLSKALSYAESFFKGYERELPLPITSVIAKDIFDGYSMNKEDSEYISQSVKAGKCKGDDRLIETEEDLLKWVTTLIYNWGKDQMFPTQEEYKSGSREKRGD